MFQNSYELLGLGVPNTARGGDAWFVSRQLAADIREMINDGLRIFATIMAEFAGLAACSSHRLDSTYSLAGPTAAADPC